jgi:phosphohistidine phosphatase
MERQMNLYLMRHGPAVEREKFRGRDDSQRPLTPEGREKMRDAARGMLALGLSFDLILSSPYVRAHETADLVAKVFTNRRHLKLTDLLTPEADPAEVIRHLATLPRTHSILLVGHEPHLSTMLAKLVGARTPGTLKLRKGALGLVSVEKSRHASGARLEWLLTARHLARIKG